MTFLKSFIKRIFQYEARLILKKYKPKIIAITGSVGKTSTRDALYLVLSKKFFVRKSDKSFTSELGVPLTIIGCPSGTGRAIPWLKNMLIGLGLLIRHSRYPEWLILEIDGDKVGDFPGLSTWLHPDILVVTAIGEVPTHVESFGSVEGLLREKKYLLDSVARDGKVFYNLDDVSTANFVYKSDVKRVSCGLGEDCDVRGLPFTILYAKNAVVTGMSFEIRTDEGDKSISIFDSIGIHNEYACLIAYAVGKELGIPTSMSISALGSYKALPGRMNIITGLKETTIIDDSYNASPIAMMQALDVFSRLIGGQAGRKIAVVGDMFELGKYSMDEHKKLAVILKEVCSHVICVGIRSQVIADELLMLGFPDSNILHVDTAEIAGGELQNMLETGDIVLVKGSQAMRMERVVEEVMRHPQDKVKLLVRQEPEWLGRE